MRRRGGRRRRLRILQRIRGGRRDHPGAVWPPGRRRLHRRVHGQCRRDGRPARRAGLPVPHRPAPDAHPAPGGRTGPGRCGGSRDRRNADPPRHGRSPMTTPPPDLAEHAADSVEQAKAVIEYCYDQGWTDGLPVVPATRSGVEQFLATTDRGAEEIIGSAPHLGRSITVAQAAANAIMAGCKPEYFPVVLAAWEAVNLERSARGAWQSTSGPSPLIVVNGPVRISLEINYQGGVFGPGFRANATIARAIGLIVRNGYGIRPQEL